MGKRRAGSDYIIFPWKRVCDIFTADEITFCHKIHPKNSITPRQKAFSVNISLMLFAFIRGAVLPLKRGANEQGTI